MSNKTVSTKPLAGEPEDVLPDEGNMTLLDHLTEFRTRLLKAAGIWLLLVICCLYFSKDILNFLLDPYFAILEGNDDVKQAGIKPRVIATALYEIFITQIKAAAFLGTILTSPVLLYQIWKFIAPGLYQHERKAFWPFMVATPFLFLLGAAMVYYILMPTAWSFFLQTQQLGQIGAIDIAIEAKISEYFGLVTRLILAFGFCFQLPVAATLMGRAGIITADGMAGARKYAVLAILCLSAILTPPDPLSLMALSLPIIGLYEISILLIRVMERGREDDEYYDDEEFLDDDDDAEDEDYEDETGDDESRT